MGTRGKLRAYFIILVALMSLPILLRLPSASAQEAGSITWDVAQQASADYSLDNLMALTLQSGLGVAFHLTDDAFNELLRQAGLMEAPLQNPYLIQAPYASGNPAYQQSPNPSDAATLLWDPAQMDRTVTPQALAYTVISELGWLVRLDREFSPEPQVLMQQRWLGRLLGRLAQLGALFARTNLRDPVTGLYHHAWREGAIVDRSFEPLDQIAMLWALAQLRQSSEGIALYDGAVFSHREAERAAHELFHVLTGEQGLLHDTAGLGAREAGLWIEALAAYASTLQDPEEIARAVHSLESAQAALTPVPSAWAPQAEALTALLTIYRLTDDEQARTEALQRWEALKKLWDPKVGLFVAPSGDVPSYLYSIQELGDAVGAFNAIVHVAGLVEVQTRYAAFFKGALRAARPSSSERFGQAPVFAASVQLDPTAQQWRIANRRFDTAGAMYLAARLNWIGLRNGEEFSMPRWGFPRSNAITLYSLREQLEALSGLVTPGLAKRVNDLDTHLGELELKLKSQGDASKQLNDLKATVAQLSNKLNDQQKSLDGQLKDLTARVGTLEKSGPALSPSRPLSSGDLPIVLLAILLILLGWVAFEWVRQRPA